MIKYLYCLLIYLSLAFLIATQPDIGMLIIISCIFVTELFIFGINILGIFITFLIFCLGIIYAYFHFPHIQQRIQGFLDIKQNYHASKSILAFQMGKLYSTGPDEGTIKQTIPDAHTDFIFSVAGEEFGMLFCLAIIWLFAYIVIKTLLSLRSKTDKFTQIAATGLIMQFGLQSVTNIGVALNLLPTKGMTLPFISYGGSSMIGISIGFGMLLGLIKKNVAYERYPFCSLEM